MIGRGHERHEQSESDAGEAECDADPAVVQSKPEYGEENERRQRLGLGRRLTQKGDDPEKQKRRYYRREPRQPFPRHEWDRRDERGAEGERNEKRR